MARCLRSTLTVAAPAMNGSVITPMNRFIASNVACCVPVRSSPETCVSPCGDSAPNASGMPPVLLKKFDQRVATFCWLMLRPLIRRGGHEIQREIEIGIVGVIAQAGLEVCRQVGVHERAEGAADAAVAVRMV